MIKTRTMNEAERRALFMLWKRNNSGHSYLSFRRKAYYSSLNGCWMVPWCGMWVGIEGDGYTHS